MTPRRLAVKALIHQEQAGYANLVLDAELKKCTPPLDSRDAAFAARIFYTTLERLPLLDYRINQFTKKPVAKLDAPVRAVLRAGLAQALYMNVPLPAAVNESVKLTRALGKSSAAGMVNAVLRRAVAADVSEADFADPLDRLSIYYCLSRPVAELFYAQFGEEAFPLAAAFYDDDPRQHTAHERYRPDRAFAAGGPYRGARPLAGGAGRGVCRFARRERGIQKRAFPCAGACQPVCRALR